MLSVTASKVYLKPVKSTLEPIFDMLLSDGLNYVLVNFSVSFLCLSIFMIEFECKISL